MLLILAVSALVCTASAAEERVRTQTVYGASPGQYVVRTERQQYAEQPQQVFAAPARQPQQVYAAAPTQQPQQVYAAAPSQQPQAFSPAQQQQQQDAQEQALTAEYLALLQQLLQQAQQQRTAPQPEAPAPEPQYQLVEATPQPPPVSRAHSIHQTRLQAALAGQDPGVAVQTLTPSSTPAPALDEQQQVAQFLALSRAQANRDAIAAAQQQRLLQQAAAIDAAQQQRRPQVQQQVLAAQPQQQALDIQQQRQALEQQQLLEQQQSIEAQQRQILQQQALQEQQRLVLQQHQQQQQIVDAEQQLTYQQPLPRRPAPEQYLRETTQPSQRPTEIRRQQQIVEQQLAPLRQRIQQATTPAPPPPAQDDDLINSLLSGQDRGLFRSVTSSSPAPPRSSIFVSRTTGRPVAAPARGSVTIEEVGQEEPESSDVPVVRLPTPKGQRPLTQSELQALIAAGFSVTPLSSSQELDASPTPSPLQAAAYYQQSTKRQRSYATPAPPPQNAVQERAKPQQQEVQYASVPSASPAPQVVETVQQQQEQTPEAQYYSSFPSPSAGRRPAVRYQPQPQPQSQPQEVDYSAYTTPAPPAQQTEGVQYISYSSDAQEQRPQQVQYANEEQPAAVPEQVEYRPVQRGQGRQRYQQRQPIQQNFEYTFDASQGAPDQNSQNFGPIVIAEETPATPQFRRRPIGRRERARGRVRAQQPEEPQYAAYEQPQEQQYQRVHARRPIVVE